jgi:hypothetical protein
MRTSTTIFAFFMILFLTGTAKYKNNNSLNDRKSSKLSPRGGPLPPHSEEMLQNQEEEDRYDIENLDDEEDGDSEEDTNEEELNGEMK